MGDDAEYYFETMMEDPEFRRIQEDLKWKHEKKQMDIEKFKYLVNKYREAVFFLSRPTTGPHNLTPDQICEQLRISKSVYCACLETKKE